MVIRKKGRLIGPCTFRPFDFHENQKLKIEHHNFQLLISMKRKMNSVLNFQSQKFEIALLLVLIFLLCFQEKGKLRSIFHFGKYKKKLKTETKTVKLIFCKKRRHFFGNSNFNSILTQTQLKLNSYSTRARNSINSRSYCEQPTKANTIPVCWTQSLQTSVIGFRRITDGLRDF